MSENAEKVEHLNNGQENLGSRRSKGHQGQIGHGIVPHAHLIIDFTSLQDQLPYLDLHGLESGPLDGDGSLLTGKEEGLR